MLNGPESTIDYLSTGVPEGGSGGDPTFFGDPKKKWTTWWF